MSCILLVGGAKSSMEKKRSSAAIRIQGLETLFLHKIAYMEIARLMVHQESLTWLLRRNIYLDIYLGKKIYQEQNGHAPSCSFRHQGERLVDGGRLFDIDGGRQVLLLARRLSGVGGTSVLSQ
ncbi:hypothetical protein IGI04_000860 [Brassica rapa subsp. trilocularis]|uniref:Uncharacterized protein n=1 Tax=Brassica rapa subsp. trilocularis TaxID=1813537 RepID=A0ABQ7NRA3_BRACM|nr:hypothetical protein IGI04_000860 [Brassica rapa subsp. trilocularis]